jgi:signal transduction histidine kinase
MRPRRRRSPWRRRRDLALSWCGTAAVVAVVYAGVMLSGGALAGGSAPWGVAVLATGAVAAVIGPAQRTSERLVARLLHGTRQAPYDVLAEFTSQVHGEDALVELPSRMARLLAEGTAAMWAQVWLLVDDRPRLVATYPPDAAADPAPPRLLDPADRVTGRRSVTVGYQGQVLGVLRVQERPGHPLTPVEERLFAGLASQAGLALHAAGVRADLQTRHHELTLRTSELQLARTRLVATEDQARRHLERDIHDGAQQQLVALGINLRLAQTLAGRDQDRARELLGSQADAAEDALTTLAALSRGDRPRVLREEGLPAALQAVVDRSPVPVTLAVRTPGDVGDLDPGIAEALYFCALEALQNTTKHAHASHVELALDVSDGHVRLRVLDDGRGVGSPHPVGSGLANMRERLTAVGGTLRVVARPDGGTAVHAVVPLAVGVLG